MNFLFYLSFSFLFQNNFSITQENNTASKEPKKKSSGKVHQQLQKWNAKQAEIKGLTPIVVAQPEYAVSTDIPNELSIVRNFILFLFRKEIPFCSI